MASPFTDADPDTGKFRVVTGGTGCDNYTKDLTGEVEVPFTGGWASFNELAM